MTNVGYIHGNCWFCSAAEHRLNNFWETSPIDTATTGSNYHKTADNVERRIHDSSSNIIFSALCDARGRLQGFECEGWLA